MTTETPIFFKTLDDWLDEHDNRVPGDLALPAAAKPEPVPTPLMDDVAEHGVGPWDDKRRRALGSPVVNLVRKPVKAKTLRQPRRAKITKGAS